MNFHNITIIKAASTPSMIIRVCRASNHSDKEEVKKIRDNP